MFYKVIVSLWVCVTTHAQSIQNNNFTISLQYVKETRKDEVNFWLLVIVKGFFKMILSFYMCLARHAQINQNNNLLFLCNTFVISLKYLKKKVSVEVDFLPSDKHECLLQIDTMFVMGMVKHFQRSQNSNVFAKKKLEVKLIFLHADKH